MTRDGCNAEISFDQLAKIATFVVAADKQLMITWVSKAVLKRVEKALGLKVSDIVECVKPLEEISLSSIAHDMETKHRFLLKNGDSLRMETAPFH